MNEVLRGKPEVEQVNANIVFRRLTVSAVGAMMTLSIGCGPSFKVIRQSGPPSALSSIENVSVQFDYSKLYVGGESEAAWVKKKTEEDADYAKTWEDLKNRLEAAFVTSFRGAAGVGERGNLGDRTSAGEAALVVQVKEIAVGKYIPFYAPPTRANADAVFKVDGEATDGVVVGGASSHSLRRPSVFQHIEPVGSQMGNTAGRFFLHSRE